MLDMLPPRTTIGQLVYRSMPAIDFRRLTTDLNAALAGCEAGTICVALEQDGQALIDVGGSRVGIALTTGLDRSETAAVTVTVGHGPAPGGDASLARRQSVLARLIAQRVAASFPPVETIWSESDEVMTPHSFERMREDLVERRRMHGEFEPARRPQPQAGVEPSDVARMFAHFEATLDARRSGRGEPATRATDGAGPAAEKRASPTIRLAAHMIDATLMLVALPVGAAMMIYSLSRGPNLNTSARALAVSGSALGLLHLAGGTGALWLLSL